jgi:hypothetical protein
MPNFMTPPLIEISSSTTSITGEPGLAIPVRAG